MFPSQSHVSSAIPSPPQIPHSSKITLPPHSPAQSIFISGEVRGDVNVEQKIVLGESCQLKGDIRASIITIEEGANFDGMCNMVQNKEPKIEQINTSNQQ